MHMISGSLHFLLAIAQLLFLLAQVSLSKSNDSAADRHAAAIQLHAIAKIHSAARDYSSALPLYEESVLLSASCGECWKSLGDTYVALDEYAKGQDALAKAKALLGFCEGKHDDDDKVCVGSQSLGKLREEQVNANKDEGEKKEVYSSSNSKQTVPTKSEDFFIPYYRK
jgi:tetratricopeptide (TPR) repeat protein